MHEPVKIGVLRGLEREVPSFAATSKRGEEWSEMARAGIKRRDHLILLGLAKRKSPRKPE